MPGTPNIGTWVFTGTSKTSLFSIEHDPPARLSRGRVFSFWAACSERKPRGASPYGGGFGQETPLSCCLRWDFSR